jgi:hypothetical protein
MKGKTPECAEFRRGGEDAGISMSVKEKPRRLCSEIQLFDLCTKEKCGAKDGRFCLDEILLAKFENISQEDDFPVEQYLAEDVGEDGEEEADEELFPGFSREFADDEDDYDEES